MNIIEKQTELSKSLYQINAATLRETFSLQKENIEKYFETNREFGSRFPEVKDVTSFVSLQREYGETLWSNVVASYKAQSEIVRTAFEGTKDAVQTAFSQDSEAAEATETVEAEAVAETAIKANAEEVPREVAPKKVAKTKLSAEEKPKAKVKATTAKAKPKARAKKASKEEV